MRLHRFLICFLIVVELSDSDELYVIKWLVKLVCFSLHQRISFCAKFSVTFAFITINSHNY